MMARLGVLVCVFARENAGLAESSSAFSCSSGSDETVRSGEDTYRLYFLLALHTGLAIVACTCRHGEDSRFSACAGWCLLGVTSFFAGQSQEREALVLIFSEFCAVICSATMQQQADAPGKMPVGQVLGLVRHAKESAQRSASKLALMVASRALDALAFSSPRAAPVGCKSKAWTARLETVAREILSRQVILQELRVSSTTISSSGELFNMETSGTSQACSFELDMQCDLDGNLNIDSAPQACRFVGVTLSARAKVSMPEPATTGGDNDAHVSLSNFKASCRSRNKDTEDGGMREAMQTKVARLIESSLSASLQQPLGLDLASRASGVCDMAESVAGCGLCLLLRVSLFGDQNQEGQADGWRVRARVLSPMECPAGAANAWHRGRCLDITSGPRRSALTLMVASEHDLIEMQVLKGDDCCVGIKGKDADSVLGTWTGEANALLVSSAQNTIRVEGDVRLSMAGTRSLGVMVSSRLVKLEAGAASDLREVPGLGLRGLVGVVAGCVEELMLSPWDCTANDGSRFIIIECSVGTEISSSHAVSCKRFRPRDEADKMTGSLQQLGAETSFLLPLNYASTPGGHVLRVRLLQGSQGRSDVPLRCLGQAELALPGEEDSLIGATRVEITDGPAKVAQCKLSFSLKRAPWYRVSKTRFADSPTAVPRKRASGAAQAADTSEQPTPTHKPDCTSRGPGPSPSPSPLRLPSSQLSPSPSPPTAASSTGILKRTILSPSSPALADTTASPSKMDLATASAPTGSVNVECVRTYSDPHNGHVVSCVAGAVASVLEPCSEWVTAP